MHANEPRFDFPSLTTPQVAQRLSVSEATIFRMLRSRTGPPSYKIGKRRLFRESDVLVWLESECRDNGRVGG